MEAKDRQALADAIHKIVDKWVSDLIGRLLSGDNSGPKRTLWDRFKGGVSNLMYGRDNKNNPYYNMNRFGDDLGWRQTVRSECFNPGFMNLHEYAAIKSSIDEAEMKAEAILVQEEDAGGELRIVSLLKQSAEELKKSLNSFILGDDGAGKVTDVGTPPPSPEPSAPRKQNEPRTVRDRSVEPATAAREEPPAKPMAAAEEKPIEPTSAAEEEPPAAPAEAEPTETKPTEKEGEDELKKPAATRRSQPSFSNSLREAVKALKDGHTSSLTPEKSWLTPNGKISYLALPKAVAWLGLKSHINIEDDEQVKNELKKAIGDEFKGLPISKKEGNSLLKSLVSKLPEDSWASTLRDLGVDESLAEKMKTRKQPPVEQQSSDDGDKPSKILERIRDESSNLSVIVLAVKERIVKPVMKKTANKHALRDWWRNFVETDHDIDSFKKKIMNDGESELISTLARVSGLEESDIMDLIA